MLKKFIALATLVFTISTNSYLTIDNYGAVLGKVQQSFKEKGNYLTFLKTSDGQNWVVDGKLKKKDKYLIIFNNNNTPNDIEDDYIIKLIKWEE